MAHRLLNGLPVPLDRAHLDEAIKEFFRRIPGEHQKTICDVIGLETATAERLRLPESALLDQLAAWNDDKLAQFLMLCSFAHYGANRYQDQRVSQQEVVRLSEECGVNHALIDAEVSSSAKSTRHRQDGQDGPTGWTGFTVGQYC